MIDLNGVFKTEEKFFFAVVSRDWERELLNLALVVTPLLTHWMTLSKLINLSAILFLCKLGIIMSASEMACEE